MVPRTVLAPAKINLTLHVTGRRADGYHTLDSLVVFAETGDRLTLEPGEGPALRVSGPLAAGVPTDETNLVMQAARLIGARSGILTLEKHLPAASGMGGGSSDAAAALKLMAAAGGFALPDTGALMGLGADLPVCMAAPLPCRMRGLGERVEPVAGVPALDLVLVNPGLPLATPTVFKGLVRRDNPPMPDPLPRWHDAGDLAGWLAGMRNDLEAPACAVMPEIASLLDEIAALPGCLVARMTGSGATCFGLFTGPAAAQSGAGALAGRGRFVAATRTHASPVA